MRWLPRSERKLSNGIAETAQQVLQSVGQDTLFKSSRICLYFSDSGVNKKCYYYSGSEFPCLNDFANFFNTVL